MFLISSSRKKYYTRKKSTLLLIVALLCFLLPAQAQRFSMETWHKGAIQLKTGKIINGLLRYDLSADVVSFEVDNEQFTFTAGSINTFFFQDFLDSTDRSFITYNYETSEGYESPRFFEFIFEGKLPLLCREQISFISSPDLTGGFGGYNRYLEFIFFYINPVGKVELLPLSRRKLVPIFRGKESEMKNYMKENHINLRSKDDMIRLFKYYDSLFE